MLKRFQTALLVLLLAGGVASGWDFPSRAYNYCADFGSRAFAPVSNPNSAVFTSVFQRYAKGDDGGNPTTKYRPTSLAIGWVYRPSSRNYEAGISFNWEHGVRRMSWDGGGRAKGRSNMLGFALFGTVGLDDMRLLPWFSTRDMYMTGSMFLGWRTGRAKDVHDSGIAYSNSNRKTKAVFAMSVEFGKNYCIGGGNWFMTPHAGIDYAYTAKEVYGAPGYRIRIKNQNYWEIPLGVTFSTTTGMGGWDVTPKLDVTMINTLGKMDVRNIQPGFSYRVADRWKVAGIGAGHFGGRVTAGIDARLGERVKVGFDYTFEGRKDYYDHRLSATFGLSF